MPQTLSTGLIIAGAYADKVRRVLFAQLRDAVKSGELTNQEVARAAALLNRVLFTILVEHMKTDKGDVIRARIDYEVRDGEIHWLWDTLRLEVFRRVPQDEVDEIVRAVAGQAGEIGEAQIYRVERAGETPLGDIVYKIFIGDREVGALIVTPVDNEVVVKGAVSEPTPLILKRSVLEVSEDIDRTIAENVNRLMSGAEQTSRDRAERVVLEILDELQ